MGRALPEEAMELLQGVTLFPFVRRVDIRRLDLNRSHDCRTGT